MILRAGSVMTYRKKCRNVEQSITGKERGKWKIMRNRFDRQLQVLNDELIEMGSLIEQAIEMACSALVRQDVEKAQKAISFDEEIDHQERDIESLCMKLLLQQQPVAKDLRLISAALKMITDMERIGDHASDISEMTILMADAAYETGDPINLDLIKEMAKETTDMVIKSVDAFVQKDMDMAHWVIKEDDVVDDLFNQFKQQLIKKINENVKNGEQATDMLMVAKYFERIGDHASYIAHMANEMHDNHTEFSQAAWDELNIVMEAVREEINVTCNAFMKDDKEAAQRVAPLGAVITLSLIHI